MRRIILGHLLPSVWVVVVMVVGMVGLVIVVMGAAEDLDLDLPPSKRRLLSRLLLPTFRARRDSLVSLMIRRSNRGS